MYRQNTTELRRAMDRLERWFRAHIDAEFFNDGSPAADGALGALHARWNGQRTEETPFYRAFYLLDAEGTVQEKSMMDRLAREERWPRSWWNPDWIPFGADLMGQLLVLDSRSGAIIEFVHDDEPRPRHGDTLESFLNEYADALEAGRWALRDGYIVDLEEHEEAALARLARARERAAREEEHRRGARRAFLVVAALTLVAVLTAIVLWECRTH